MKKTKVIIAILFGAIISICWTTFRQYDVKSPCDSPVVGDHSGAPGETDCTACHGGSPNTGSGLLEFHVGNDSTYVPGQTYTCNVKMTQTGLSKFGFVDLALKNSGNTTIGTFNLIDVVRTRKYTLGGRKYLSHTPCGADTDTVGKNEWSYSWTAPSSDVGTITFYISGLAANHNEATTGDFTYTKTIVLNPSSVSSIQEISGAVGNISVFPNPVSRVLNISYQNLSDEKTEIKLLDLQGKTIKILTSGYPARGIIKETFSVQESGIEPGAYLLSIVKGNKQLTRKLLIQ